jgi:ABC-type multidrug transport system fused ATPase/permease subunit
MIDLDLDVEEEDQDRGFEPPAHWPSRDSVVQVENLTCHYAPQVRPSFNSCRVNAYVQLEPVLRGVSFEIGPKEKIGICGRTGSGKSSKLYHPVTR